MARLRWTSKQDAFLLKRAQEGASPQQVADELRWHFGVIFSRNAVIGRAHRLCGRKRHRGQHFVVFKQVQRGLLRLSKEKPRKKYKQKYRPRKKEYVMPEIAKDEPPPSGLRLWQLQEHQCKWPHGDREFTFCGADRDGASPYCLYHSDKAWSSAYKREIGAAFHGRPLPQRLPR